jgi:uncharacterized protein YfiM (DUF2279 family)
MRHRDDTGTGVYPKASSRASRRARLSIPLLALLVAHATPARAEPWDGPDKRVHLVAGVAVAANGVVLANALELDAAGRALSGLALGVTVGAAKEGLDALGLGTASAADFAWTAAGALVGAGLAWLFSVIVK